MQCLVKDEKCVSYDGLHVNMFWKISYKTESQRFVFQMLKDDLLELKWVAVIYIIILVM